jgi:hypothetical protein
MESVNRQQAEKMLNEQTVSASKQAAKRQEVRPGLKKRDGFGTPGEGGAEEYYAPSELEEPTQKREAADEIPEANPREGPDEGRTGFGPGGASDPHRAESIDEIERAGNA